MLPVLEWLPRYDTSRLRLDVVAGITVAAVLVPEALAYASLANLPPETGLYAALLSVSAYFLFGTSRQLVVGPTSALAILLASGVGAVAGGSTASYASLVVLTTMLVGVFAIVAWAFQLGFLVHFISGSVLTGFSAGAALYIMSTQLTTLIGIPSDSSDAFVAQTFFGRLWYTGTHFAATNPETLGVGVAGIALLVLGERYLPRAPTALVVVILSIVLMSVTDLAARGVSIVGSIPSGLPALTAPAIPSLSTLSSLVPVAVGLFLLSYVEGISAVETFARRHDYQTDSNQELLADGVANLAAGLAGGFAVGGSMSRSALNDAVGGETQLTSAVVALVLAVVLVFLTGVFANLPETILAAIVIVAVTGLIDAESLRQLYRVSRTEFAIAMAAFFGVLSLGMLWGVFVGVVLSLLVAVSRVSRPSTHELGQVAGTDGFVALDLYPAATTISDVFVYRVEAELFYANADTVRSDLLERIETRSTDVELVVFDLTSSPTVDFGAAQMLADLSRDLDGRAIDLRFAGAESEVVQMFETMGLAADVGGVRPEESVDEAIARWRAEEPSKSEGPH
ncbi:high affinity sulphate transporter 1 [Halomicrobium zhouii]|uniref:High affinity sulphate transporter 1 n=1 Tax=Halomicrobium zhouii TaxID=767519 RepID=A0A1I6KJK0_9EURY|nr:sulfate permease [Halomicrobium zhouii]SFR91040.1 high affinity sulphate transporter 1 [Halomicrobium zhouii]